MGSIADFALAHVNEGYIYGAKGQRCSLAFRIQQAAQYPEWHETIMGIGAKWDGKPVWDCAQLTRFAAAAAGYNLPSGATSQWEKAAWAARGEINTLPEGREVFLYRRSGKKMQHTGISLGDGTCVHAAGTVDGVIHRRIGTYPWTHWASLTPLDEPVEEDTDMERLTVTAASGSTVFLRKEPTRKADYLARVPVGQTVIKLGSSTVDGVEWIHAKYGGTAGYIMAKYLVGSGAEEATGETVTLTIDRQAAQMMLDALSAAMDK